MEHYGIMQRQLAVIAAKNHIVELGQVTLTYSTAPSIILPSHWHPFSSSKGEYRDPKTGRP
jgi:hypothetical protein